MITQQRGQAFYRSDAGDVLFDHQNRQIPWDITPRKTLLPLKEWREEYRKQLDYLVDYEGTFAEEAIDGTRAQEHLHTVSKNYKELLNKGFEKCIDEVREEYHFQLILLPHYQKRCKELLVQAKELEKKKNHEFQYEGRYRSLYEERCYSQEEMYNIQKTLKETEHKVKLYRGGKVQEITIPEHLTTLRRKTFAELFLAMHFLGISEPQHWPKALRVLDFTQKLAMPTGPHYFFNEFMEKELEKCSEWLQQHSPEEWTFTEGGTYRLPDEKVDYQKILGFPYFEEGRENATKHIFPLSREIAEQTYAKKLEEILQYRGKINFEKIGTEQYYFCGNFRGNEKNFETLITGINPRVVGCLDDLLKNKENKSHEKWDKEKDSKRITAFLQTMGIVDTESVGVFSQQGIIEKEKLHKVMDLGTWLYFKFPGEKEYRVYRRTGITIPLPEFLAKEEGFDTQKKWEFVINPWEEPYESDGFFHC